MKPEIDALRARAEQGDAPAQFALGVMYAEAVRWYGLAAEQGHARTGIRLLS